MKTAYAVTANSGLDSDIDARFGRATGFLIVDDATGNQQYISNEQNLNAPQGAGIQAAQHILNSGAEALAVPHCGPKAFKVLSAGQVKIYLVASGKVSEVSQAITAGKYNAATQADVEGHWE